jgi:hypothetical protein
MTALCKLAALLANLLRVGDVDQALAVVARLDLLDRDVLAALDLVGRGRHE